MNTHAQPVMTANQAASFLYDIHGRLSDMEMPTTLGLAKAEQDALLQVLAAYLHPGTSLYGDHDLGVAVNAMMDLFMCRGHALLY